MDNAGFPLLAILWIGPAMLVIGFFILGLILEGIKHMFDKRSK